MDIPSRLQSCDRRCLRPRSVRVSLSASERHVCALVFEVIVCPRLLPPLTPILGSGEVTPASPELRDLVRMESGNTRGAEMPEERLGEP